MNVCPLHKAGITRSQRLSIAAAAPTLGPGDKVLREARRPSMFNGPARKLQRKQSERVGGKEGGDLRLFVAEGLLAGQMLARVFTCFSPFELDLPVILIPPARPMLLLLFWFQLTRNSHPQQENVKAFVFGDATVISHSLLLPVPQTRLPTEPVQRRHSFKRRPSRLQVNCKFSA